MDVPEHNIILTKIRLKLCPETEFNSIIVYNTLLKYTNKLIYLISKITSTIDYIKSRSL